MVTVFSSFSIMPQQSEPHYHATEGPDLHPDRNLLLQFEQFEQFGTIPQIISELERDGRTYGASSLLLAYYITIFSEMHTINAGIRKKSSDG